MAFVLGRFSQMKPLQTHWRDKNKTKQNKKTKCFFLGGKAYLTSIISPAQKLGVPKGQASSATAATHGVRSLQELGEGSKGPDEKVTVMLSCSTVVSSVF